MQTADIRDKASLIDCLNDGHKIKYIYFWGHKPRSDGTVGKSCFSQWFDAGFTANDCIYKTAEHYMMAEKARLFNDKGALQKILSSKHPGEAKRLGREITNFDNTLWNEKRFTIVVKGNLAKFSQNDALKSFLLNTGERVLVEASPVDKIWGIGLASDHKNAGNPHQWPGLNLLGFALMQARQLIRSGGEQA